MPTYSECSCIAAISFSICSLAAMTYSSVVGPTTRVSKPCAPNPGTIFSRTPYSGIVEEVGASAYQRLRQVVTLRAIDSRVREHHRRSVVARFRRTARNDHVPHQYLRLEFRCPVTDAVGRAGPDVVLHIPLRDDVLVPLSELREVVGGQRALRFVGRSVPPAPRMSLKTMNQFSMSRTPRANLLYCSVRRGLHSSTTKM